MSEVTRKIDLNINDCYSTQYAASDVPNII